MSEKIITVEDLSKIYLLDHRTEQRERYTALRDVITLGARNFARRTVNLLRGQPFVQDHEVERFWALKNLNFEIYRGEVVGVIGRNGAGKSTLLKILSRITEPSSGRVVLGGRVASLLEVGTGFHAELTGRENIFLNGAILGMKQREIRKKFDEIVAFSEIERFLDTPVKRYSSGMFVRLAFAVAAHLEPEILLVDEILAVGDADFQKKCLGKIEDISRSEGRTVLFVSHNLAAVADLTKRGIVLESGSIVADAPISDAISTYLFHGPGQATYIASPARTSARPYVSKIEVLTSKTNGLHDFKKALEIRFWIRHLEAMSKSCFSFQIVNQFQHAAVHAWALYPEFIYGTEAGETLLTCIFPSLRLNVGHYHLRTYLTEPPGQEIYEKLDGLCPFEVVRTEDTMLWGWHPDDCVYYEDCAWTVERCQ
jgi:lipopolysaccharide transport system ATP-binding protein